MLLRFISAALLAAICASPALGDETWRLFVADHTEPKVTAVDLSTGAVVNTFELSGPGTLYVTESKRGVYAVQGTANKVLSLIHI